MSNLSNWAEYLDRVCETARRIRSEEIESFINAIEDAYRNERFVFVIGNGGSSANASHICEDLGKGTLTDLEHQRRLKILSLTDNTPYILAWGNDTSYERIFVEQLKNLAGPGDFLIAISGSGNSPNILCAVEYANSHQMKSFGITGYDGGRLKQIAHHSLNVPCMDMGMSEAIHMVFFHYVLDVLRERFKSAVVLEGDYVIDVCN